jgi:hypothetical protein
MHGGAAGSGAPKGNQNALLMSAYDGAVDHRVFIVRIGLCSTPVSGRSMAGTTVSTTIPTTMIQANNRSYLIWNVSGSGS